jgi:glycosyltransferase involved in cell wall biosynthesis
MEEINIGIFIAIHNKTSCLPNTFESINRQRTRDNVTVYIVDDGSDDPGEIVDVINNHLRVPYFLMTLSKNIGFAKSQSKCLDLVDSSVNVIILQSCDVLYGDDYLLQRMVDELRPGMAVMPEVRNVAVPPDLWKDWDIAYYLQEERLYETLRAINKDPKQPNMGEYGLQHTIFAGPRQPAPDRRLYFFLGAILREDLDRTCFATTCGDVALAKSMISKGIQVKYVEGIGLHQKHPIGG